MKTKFIFLNILVLLAGGIMPFAFAPMHLFPLAPLSIAALLWAWLHADSPKACAIFGFLFGIGMFGVGVSWVYISIHVYGNTNVFLSVLITALFISALALFPTVQGYLLKRFFSLDKSLVLITAFPASWVLLEWVRGKIFTGFPWLYLGFSQTGSPLRGYAPLFGSFAVSFVVVLSAVLVVLVIRNIGLDSQQSGNDERVCGNDDKQIWKNRIIPLFILVLFWSFGIVLTRVSWTQPTGQPMQVSLVQGNVPQQIKWNPQQVLPTIEKYIRLTQPHWDSPLIVWPEAAIPLPLPFAHSDVDKLKATARKHHSYLLTGIPIETDSKIYNGAVLLGMQQGQYLKRHLVPFGEYVPLEKIFRGLIQFLDLPMSSFSAGHMQPLMKAGRLPIALYICYEIAYSDLVRSDLPQAQVLITISDDAWFGKSSAAAQHLQIGQMRSIESGRYGLFCANNGITAVISPKGRIIRRLPQFEEGVLTAKITGMKGSTPWVFWGDLPILLFSILTLLIALSINKKSS
ncbi:MAG: apolipoprotein N-acyltransferase [Gammaproteobacteria bacterium]|nr:apolipoprotein N-acyltransferase [Gammaproteobacteria bacterium]